MDNQRMSEISEDDKEDEIFTKDLILNKLLEPDVQYIYGHPRKIIEYVSTNRSIALKVLNSKKKEVIDEFTKLILNFCPYESNPFRSIISSKSYYISKSNIPILMSCGWWIRLSMIRRNVKYMYRYYLHIYNPTSLCDDLDPTLSRRLIKETIKQHECTFRNIYSILNLKYLIKFIKPTPKSFIDDGEQFHYNENIITTIVFSNTFKFNIYLSDGGLLIYKTYCVAQNTIILIVNPSEYFQLSVRKRSRQRIKLMQGNIVETSINRILQKFTSKNISKLISFFA